MGRTRENPRYNVISLRVADDERKRIEAAVERSGLTKGTLVRELVLEAIEARERASEEDPS